MGDGASTNTELVLSSHIADSRLSDSVWVETLDGDMEEIEKEVALLSPVLASQILRSGGGSASSPIQLPKQVLPEILKLVLEYCRFHRLVGRSDLERKLFDERFIRVLDTRRLCELTSAADSLDMAPLVDLTSRGLARLIEGKTPEEIRDTFHLPDDLTEEEKLEPVSNMKDDPRIRLLNRLYAKKRRDLQEKRLVLDGAQQLQIQQQQIQQQQHQAAVFSRKADERTVDELLRFIESKADEKAKGGRKKKGKRKGARGDSMTQPEVDGVSPLLSVPRGIAQQPQLPLGSGEGPQEESTHAPHANGNAGDDCSGGRLPRGGGPEETPSAVAPSGDACGSGSGGEDGGGASGGRGGGGTGAGGSLQPPATTGTNAEPKPRATGAETSHQRDVGDAREQEVREEQSAHVRGDGASVGDEAGRGGQRQGQWHAQGRGSGQGRGPGMDAALLALLDREIAAQSGSWGHPRQTGRRDEAAAAAAAAALRSERIERGAAGPSGNVSEELKALAAISEALVQMQAGLSREVLPTDIASRVRAILQVQLRLASQLNELAARVRKGETSMGPRSTSA